MYFITLVCSLVFCYKPVQIPKLDYKEQAKSPLKQQKKPDLLVKNYIQTPLFVSFKSGTFQKVVFIK